MSHIDKLNSKDKAHSMSICIDALHMAANCLSPDGRTQTAFIRMIAKMQKNNEPNTEIAKQLLRSMHDGLAVGNWPTVE